VFLVGFLFVGFFRGSFSAIDKSLNVWIPSIQTSSLTLTCKGIALAFDFTFLSFFSLLIAAILFVKNRRAESLFLLGAIGGDALIVFVVKNIVESPRPLNAIVAYSGYSFPSGHTAGTIVFCGSLAFFAWQHWKSTKVHASLGVAVGTISSVVGFSRLYLNVHWFSDVLGAGLLGVFWLTFAVLMFKLFERTGKLKSERFKSVSKVPFVLGFLVAISILILGLLGYFHL
jgi:undecaprenyl-diphosphatase